MLDWILRFFKGILIGSGFILPGVSGGVLAVIFGVYQRIISFLANITKDFKKNFLYLLPLGLGGVAGVFIFSILASYVMGAYEVQILWFFVGCIVGTVPMLWKQAGQEGRNKKDIWILVVSFIIFLAFLSFGNLIFGAGIPQNIFTWILAGALIGLGVIVPGLSPSNLLVYMGMYKAMTDGIKDINFGVIIPIAIGGLAAVLLFSKVMEYAFKKHYSGMFHAILGLVLASTIMIIPTGFNYLSLGTIACLILFAAGTLLGYWMGNLEDKYQK